MRRCFELYSTGDYSLRALVEWARQNGLTFRKNGNPVNGVTLYAILHNPIYCGVFDWRGIHEAIISVDLWDRVQIIVADRYARSKSA